MIDPTSSIRIFNYVPFHRVSKKKKGPTCRSIRNLRKYRLEKKNSSLIIIFFFWRKWDNIILLERRETWSMGENSLPVSIKKMKRKLWSYQHHSSGPSLFSRLPPGHAESNPVKDVDGRPAGCLVTRKISQLKLLELCWQKAREDRVKALLLVTLPVTDRSFRKLFKSSSFIAQWRNKIVSETIL